MTRQWNPDAADPALTSLARTPMLLVALDFDGTSAPLVDEPMAARALPAVRTQVERLAALPRTAVAYISGRSMDDLRVIAEHDDASSIILSGSHGAQYWHPGDGQSDGHGVDVALRDALILDALAAVAGLEGVMIEPKAFGFAVHTRLASADTAERAYAAVRDFMDVRAPQWRRRAGHDVLEFSASDAGKDTAIGLLRERTGATAVLFAGDDVTDEDAIRALGPEDVGVRVGAGETSAALRVDDPQQLAMLLAALAAERGGEHE